MKARAMPFLLALAVLVPAVTAADPPAAGAQPPRAERLAWPLQVGKSGSSWGTWRWQDSSAGRDALFTWSMAVYEEVSVPVGAIKTSRLLLAKVPAK